jgi:hypothetical protein
MLTFTYLLVFVHEPPWKLYVFPPTLTVALAGPQNVIALLPPIVDGPGVHATRVGAAAAPAATAVAAASAAATMPALTPIIEP